ncbi:hypothetical protein [Bacillus sp. XF8]|uniref:hypothetical protein n=1 Tax=Bacillus sp. XF8 TaxID=2819289 RepID=UPI001AA01558|nr:hypothetical protein [Bacillus sp. XF8]MBO1583297.1 hypothetical protein [Bacillus sp. XF8]
MSKAGVAKTQEFRKPRKYKRVKLEERVVDGEVAVGKECSKCGDWKPLESGFRKNNKGLGGKLSVCKKCERKYARNHYEENKEKVAERKRNYYQENKEIKIEYSRKYCEENKEKVAEHRRKYREKHKERIAEYRRKYYEENKAFWHNYYQENKEIKIEYSRKYREENKEKVAECGRKWRRENREICTLIYQRRRARKRALPDDFTTEQLNEILAHFEGGCVLTGDSDIHWDHVIPIAIGHGGTTYGNMIPLRSDLNISKSDNNIFEWFEANRQRFELPQERFDRLIEWLAAANEMTVGEYRDYVYWCHANPVDVLESEAI